MSVLIAAELYYNYRAPQIPHPIYIHKPAGRKRPGVAMYIVYKPLVGGYSLPITFLFSVYMCIYQCVISCLYVCDVKAYDCVTTSSVECRQSEMCVYDLWKFMMLVILNLMDCITDDVTSCYSMNSNMPSELMTHYHTVGDPLPYFLQYLCMYG